MRNRSLFIAAMAILVLIVSGCTLGETVLPNPTPLSGPAPTRSGVVAPIPAPIPHSLEGRADCFACHAIGAVDASPVPAGHAQDVTGCTACHAVWTQSGIASVAPPAISHDTTGREECLACHKVGTVDAPRNPDNHAGLLSDICQSCHLGSEDISGATTDSVSVAAPIPHGREGFESCTLCHGEGVGGAPQFPSDHAGRTDDVCTACHSPSESEMLSPESSEEPAVDQNSSAEGSGGSGAVPAVPHGLEGFSACSVCHEKGSSTIPAYPADHSGRSDDSCTACHQP